MNEYKLPFDLNADIGEGVGNDEALIPYLSSCNIACGGHTGDLNSMRESIQICKKYGIKVGAHPSYPDSKNFGRKHVVLTQDQFQKVIAQQITTFQSVCENEGVEMNHIKPHGALYNTLSIDPQESQWFVEMMKTNFSNLNLYVPPQSVIENVAIESGIKILREAFADRSYTDDGKLVERIHPLALLTDHAKVKNQMMEMVLNKSVKTISGKTIKMNFDTICIHGDNPSVLEIVKVIYNTFKAKV
ncbi:5-oxoprolinase subunit PxpA [Belliella kenyensis]|uniref:5-oxoprolinase subunit PxpA n=1 Tax=Belliella kenyensis TaxID=1472724 RepID=A0ABV8EL69_9BACT|nr:5-oxoprolinase subunit PxpA [Belliella kenyensis]MCH7400381.1 5-oxoprolinase subunit PxpA [Belliella kenyensis]MDN3604601.1 5-oxoprolinase subunit PxpA [Belliella kenyensis]